LRQLILPVFFSPLTRKLASSLRGFQCVHGIGRLLFESVRHVQNQFHSRLPESLPLWLSYLDADPEAPVCGDPAESCSQKK
jgi:hypothetical protein